jgi:large subunit ribosomal protein L18
MCGSAQKPRLILRRSLKNLSAQVVDDTANKVLFSLSTLDKEIKKKFACSGNVQAADYFGQVFAARAKEKGIGEIIFDRAGYLYHGRVKAFADSLRKGGIKF